MARRSLKPRMRRLHRRYRSSPVRELNIMFEVHCGNFRVPRAESDTLTNLLWPFGWNNALYTSLKPITHYSFVGERILRSC